jgi:hypothetical protein
MKKSEYEALVGEKASPPKVSVAMLTNKSPRTLLFGYTAERATWHVYLGPDQKIHLVTYVGDALPMLLDHLAFSENPYASNSSLVPPKRAYPEHCDYEFAMLLASHGESVPYTTFTEREPSDREIKVPYAGLTLEQLAGKESVLLRSSDILKSTGAVVPTAALSAAASSLRVPKFEVFLGIRVSQASRDAVVCEALRLTALVAEFQENAYNSADDFSQWLARTWNVFDAVLTEPEFGPDVVSTRFNTPSSLTIEALQSGLQPEGRRSLDVTVLPNGGLFITGKPGTNVPARAIVPVRRIEGDYRLFEQRYCTPLEMQSYVSMF